MDSSPVLRQQSQNKIHSDFLRMKNEHNKVRVDKQPSKHVSAPQLSNQDHENNDPGSTEKGRPAPVRPGVSRLPVLAKSLRLQTPLEFSQSHSRWEENPLAGKAKKKKPCIRAVPFNLSQPNSSTTSKNQQALSVPRSQTGTQSVKPGNSVCNVQLKTQKINTKPSKHPAVSNSHGKRQPALSTETCLENMNLLSLKDPTTTLPLKQNAQPTTQSSKGSTDKGENFDPDHAALLSILCNEGVSTTGPGSATPQSKPYNYLPQRVSVMKSRSKAGPITGSVKLVQFSPDATALQSILWNEGVNGGGLVGATPRQSVCPSGRGTSVYTAQRVPVRKNHVEVTDGPVAIAVKDSLQKTWTPQRVRNTRHQPMSAMKWHQSTQQTPYAGTPFLRRGKTNPQPHQEEVVQRLFDDHEEELNTNVTHEGPETKTDQLLAQVSSTKPQCEGKVETSTGGASEEASEEEKEPRVVGGQAPPQAQQRESVIFFSTSKKVIRAPRFEKQGSWCDQDRHGPLSAEQTSVSHTNLPVQPQHRDIVVEKSCGLSPAVALLRKRLPPLEELRMDEEVAIYTSVSVSAPPGFVPPRPRCGNPLASILLFEESSRFVPISFDLPSGPSSPLSSPQQER